jgi:hypothetical protein
MRYIRPDIGENTLAYKGRRYWIIKSSPGGKFDFVTCDLAEYVMWDCLCSGVLAILKHTDCGVSSTLMSHVELTYAFDDIEQAAKVLPVYWDDYLRVVD